MKNIKNFFLLGGTISIVEAGVLLKKKKLKYFIFTSKRQLKDKIIDNINTLEDVLKRNNLHYKVVENINTNSFFHNNFDENSLCLGFGEPWKFHNNFIARHKSRLYDFMCIPLPHFRGGAHYTWMSMMQRTDSSVCIQEITKNTIQGKFDDGNILMRKNFKVKKNSKPSDFFYLEKKNSVILLKNFFDQIIKNKKIKMKKLNESGSMFFPRLFTSKNGWVDWNWNGNDILKFMNSFDNPYNGVSTRYLKNNKVNKLVHLKDASWENKKIKFHPFQSGLIINKVSNGIIVATTDGSIKIKKVIDKNKKNILKKIQVGKRLHSFLNDLNKSKSFVPNY